MIDRTRDFLFAAALIALVTTTALVETSVAVKLVTLLAIAAAVLAARSWRQRSHALDSVIAERSSAIASQNRSEQRLAALISTATDAIITVDQEQNIIMINPAAEQLFDCAPGELNGEPLIRLIPARFHGTHPGHVAQFGGTGKTSRRMGGKVEVFGLRANGEEFPVDASISHFAEDGRMFFTVILRDITAQKKAEAELRTVIAERSSAIASQNRSEQRLAAVINTATDAIITVDQEQNIAMINPAAERLFGYLPGELIGKPLLSLIPARFHSAHPGHVTEFGGTGKTSRRMGGKVEVFGVRANGEEFPVDASISHFAEDGRMFFTVILRDITAEKMAEVALTESQRELRALSDNLLTAREEERKHIARELHDDLGQRLAALRNDFTLLRKGIDAAPADAARHVSTAAGIDALLVDTIASLRRISADLRPRPLDDLGLVAAIRVLAEDFSRQHSVRCQIKADDVEPHVDARTAVALYRMVQESLNNAAKHARASEIDIGLVLNAEGLIVEIADNGVGMTDAEMRKRGSFGLIGMRERATALGGTFRVQSAPGEGTRLTLNLPAAD